eukprot:TRINITY_DN35255_c0_g1_i2.p1 TRINITY_DN35255_c0_g1~~TRINITY_DN35255_c0_g1_i2.p1  ORF type:complete len:206 (-),score=27.97 TRINITY_DN35255_c0_g1_i2:1118-1735(-)
MDDEHQPHQGSALRRPWRRCGTIAFNDIEGCYESCGEILSWAGAAMCTVSEMCYVAVFRDSRSTTSEAPHDALAMQTSLQLSRGGTTTTQDFAEAELSDALGADLEEEGSLRSRLHPAAAAETPAREMQWLAPGGGCISLVESTLASLLEHAAAAYETVAEQHAALLYASPTLPRHPHTHTHTHTTLLRRGWTLSLTCCEPLILR